jgi:hypothetical protein
MTQLDSAPSGRITCPMCGCRLDITETPSGGRAISVARLSTIVDAKRLERFMPPDGDRDVICPACDAKVDPAAPYRSNTRADRRLY